MNLSRIICSSTFTVCIDSNNNLYGFGNNSSNQLGNSKDKMIHFPIKIKHLPQIKTVACGYEHTVCIDLEGFVWSFGNNNHGQLGIENINNSKKPSLISNTFQCLSVHCGAFFTIFIDYDNLMWSCGNRIGLTYYKAKKPTKSSLSKIIHVSCGENFTYTIDENGSIYRFGSNTYGQLEKKGKKLLNIEEFIELDNVLSIECGRFHTIFLLTNGDVYGCGNNNCGQIGRSINSFLHKIEGLPPIKRISCGNDNSKFIDFDNNLWVLGKHIAPHLNNKSQINITIPEMIPNIYPAEISKGGNCTIIKDIEGNIWGCGSNINSTLGFNNKDKTTYEWMELPYLEDIIGFSQSKQVKSARK